MPRTVRQVFEDYSDLTPDDTGLASRILRFEQYVLNRTPQHTEFFGGNLLGHPIARWNKSIDDKRWLEEVCLIDDIRNCQNDLYECEHINKDFKVISDIFNLSVVWILNVLYRQDKRNGKGTPAVEAALVINMARHLTSFMEGRFQYGSDPMIAQAMFERLDNKNDFKIEGSWINLLRARTDIFLNTEGRYPDVWMEMVNDDRTRRMCQEVNGNLRTTVNLLTEKYYVEKQRHDRMMRSSKVGQIDGEKLIKDYIRKADKLKDDMLRVCAEPNALIKGDIMVSTVDIATTTDSDLLTYTLNYFSDNLYSKDKWHTIPEELTLLVLDLSRQNKVDFSSVYDVTTHIRSLFKSSGTTNKNVVSLKKTITMLVKKANPKERDAKLASLVGGFITYLTIRLMAIDYYK